MIDPTLARQIKLLGFDVDGVLTDNGLFLGEAGGTPVELKRFDVTDGLGYALLSQVDIRVLWISGRKSAATTRRAEELRITDVLQVRSHTKAAAVASFLQHAGLSWEQMAYVGDDLIDLPVMERVALPIAVANARPEVKDFCHWTTTATGGHGAVREVIETLLKARGEFEFARTQYLTHGSHPG